MNTGKVINIHIFVLSLFWVCETAERGLLKVPRIYNVLLSSNEMLVPSQAYPVISPVLQPVSSVYVSERSNYETKHDTIPKLQQAPPLPYKTPQIPQIEPVLQQQNIKNHKPINPDIPDVPPPPLPVSFRENGRNAKSA